jgi:hypothetical protein
MPHRRGGLLDKPLVYVRLMTHPVEHTYQNVLIALALWHVDGAFVILPHGLSLHQSPVGADSSYYVILVERVS